MPEQKKKIIIPDTNVMRGLTYQNFHDLFEILKKQGDVYVCDISIQEKLAQERMDIRDAYNKALEHKENNKHYFTVEVTPTLEEVIAVREQKVLKNIADIFGKNVIPFNQNKNTLSLVLQRAYDKVPPFIRSTSNDNGGSKNPSDKGFKDTLLWFSLLDFANSINEDVDFVFLTEDGGFIKKNAETLQNEFNDKTGKKIALMGKEYYQNLIANKTTTKADKAVIKKELSQIELQTLREQINETANDVCTVWSDDYYERQKAFTVSYGGISVDKVEQSFADMKVIIDKNIFNTVVSAKDFWKDSIEEVHYLIPIEKYIALNDLFELIKKNHSDYLPQFFHTFQGIINRNASDLPF